MRMKEGMSIFPNSTQRLVLRAGLLPPEKGIAEFRTWLAQRTTADGALSPEMDLSERRLLPLVYRNLKPLLTAEEAKLLNPVHLEYWVANQKLFHWLPQVLNQLDELGVPNLVLKGVPLAVQCYPAVACRPMSDADVLIAQKDVPAVVRCLLEQGWSAACEPPNALEIAYNYRHRQAVALHHPDGREFDLHWHVLYLSSYEKASDVFWQQTAPFPFGGVTRQTFNPSAQLVHACCHGAFANPDFPSIRWIADALMIMRAQQIDWEVVVRLAEELRVAVPLRLTLAHLREEWSADSLAAAVIPAEVLHRLAQMPVSASEVAFFERNAGLRQGNFVSMFTDFFAEHHRVTRDLPAWRRAALLPRRLQLRWCLPSLPATISYALFRAPFQFFRRMT